MSLARSNEKKYWEETFESRSQTVILHIHIFIESYGNDYSYARKLCDIYRNTEYLFILFIVIVDWANCKIRMKIELRVNIERSQLPIKLFGEISRIHFQKKHLDNNFVYERQLFHSHKI